MVLERVRYLILFGEAADLIEKSLIEERSDGQEMIPYRKCTGLKEAIQTAAEICEKGDVVLLSPGGTSFDEFIDFEERGEKFRVMGKRTELKPDPAGLDLAIDIPFLSIVAALLVFGLLMLYSASWDVSWRVSNNVNSFFLRQLLWLVLGLGVAIVLYFMDYHRWAKNQLAILAIAGTIGLLVLVLFIGDRSIFGGKSVQPSELAKLTIVIYLAVWLEAKGDLIKKFHFGLIPLAVILGLVGGLIAIQTDVSAAVTVFALGLLLFYMAGGSLVQIMLLLVISTSLGAGLVALRKPEVYQRIADFWVGIRDINTIGSEQIAKSFTAFMMAAGLA